MADHDVDLFVIGAGSGGVRAARVAASHGAHVMAAEEYRVGGTCVIRGCVPKKLLVYASRFSHEFEDAAGYGWTLPDPTFHWSALIANKDREIARLEAAYTTTLERYNVTLVKSRAVLEDAHTVRLATGAGVRAKIILISSTQSRRTKPFIYRNYRDASSYRAADILPSSSPAFLQGLAVM
jgi:glutathione reductase (NADPH)